LILKNLRHQQLESHFRRRSQDFDVIPDNELRIDRALSWLRRSEDFAKYPDDRFIFLWIAFNAAYGIVSDQSQSSDARSSYTRFLSQVVELDASQVIYNLVWTSYSDEIHGMLSNQYVFQPFWDAHRLGLERSKWTRKMAGAKRKALRALAEHRTLEVLTILFDRLYTLRNQMLHGGATWSGQVNRLQVLHGAAIMSDLVPAIISVLIDHPDQDWGPVAYPHVEKG